MIFSELVEAASTSRLVSQLLHLKRCFGSRTKIGVLVAPGEVDLCGTVGELVAQGHVSSGLEWMDPFLAAVPSVQELSMDDFVVVPPSCASNATVLSRYSDGGPSCPWDVAMHEQEAARVRATDRRRRTLSS